MPPKEGAAKSKTKRSDAPPPQKSEQEKAIAKATKKPEAAAPTDAEETEPSNEETLTEPASTPQSNISKKRKSPSSDQNNSSSKSKQPPKKPRQGTRTSSRTNKPTSTSSPTPKQIVTYLLSPFSLAHAYPDEELNHARSNQSHKTYSLTSPHTFTPFQHLLCASLLSKPLSHILGLRSIRTLLNEPFSLNSPSAITTAGEHRVWEALEAARTQHRQKTAAYVYQMGEMCQQGENDDWGETFEGLKSSKDAGSIMTEIKTRVKGMGATGAEVFLRRVQCCEGWEEVWPFADGKALQALREMGIGDVEDTAALKEIVEEVVKEMGVGLGSMGLEGLENDDVGDKHKLRIAFVVVLERGLGASLEGKSEEIRKAAMDSKY